MGKRSACSIAVASAGVLGISCATAWRPATDIRRRHAIIILTADRLLRLEFQCHAVHAVTLTRGFWAIREHMPQMSATAGAMNFGPRHSEAAIRGGANRLRQ